MRWLVVLALVACGSKEAKVPAIDRSCEVDADCVLGVDVCCTGCGGHIGEPVNRRAWEATRAARRARCANVKCPDVNCARGPDCDEEGFAVCKAGTCEREMRKTAACADTRCETAADCTRYAFHECCDQCGGIPLNKAVAERRRGEAAAACAAKTEPCPVLDCPVASIDCVNNQCVSP